MKTNRNQTNNENDNSRTNRTGGRRTTATISAALVLLTLLSSLVMSTTTTGAAPIDPGKGVEEPPPTSVTDDVALLPQVLTATLEFRCRDLNGAFAHATVTSHSPSHQMSFTFEVQGPEVDYETTAPIGPNSTVELNHFAGVNGDSVKASVKNDAGTVLAHAQATVQCGKPDPGRPDPWVTFELECQNPHDAQVVVTMGNDGSAAVVLDVIFSEIPAQSADQAESRTVDPGESQAIAYGVDEGQTYSVQVQLPGEGDLVFAQETITVDCLHGSTPPVTNPNGPTPGGAPKFTG